MAEWLVFSLSLLLSSHRMIFIQRRIVKVFKKRYGANFHYKSKAGQEFCRLQNQDASSPCFIAYMIFCLKHCRISSGTKLMRINLYNLKASYPYKERFTDLFTKQYRLGTFNFLGRMVWHSRQRPFQWVWHQLTI